TTLFRSGAIRDVFRAGGIPAAVFYIYVYRGGGGPVGRKAGVGVAAVRSRDFVLVEKNWAPSTRHDARRTGQAGRYPEYSARNDYGEQDRQGVWHGELGGGSLPRSGAEVVPRKPSAGGGVRDQFSADGHSGLDSHSPAVAARTRPDCQGDIHARDIPRVYYCCLQVVRPGPQVRAVQQQFPASGGSLVGNFPFHGYGRRSAREAGREADGEICAGDPVCRRVLLLFQFQ